MKLFFNLKTLVFLIYISSAAALLGSCHNMNNQQGERTYYFDAESGNDMNDGLDTEHPFRSLSMVQKLNLQPGDKVLLNVKSVFKESLILKNVKGLEDQEIIFSTYVINESKTNQRASIYVEGPLNAVFIEDCSYIKIIGLNLSANSGVNFQSSDKKEMRCGILIKPKNNGTTKNITLDDLFINNVFYEKAGFQRPKKEVHSANGTQNYGWGIRIINSNKEALLKNIIIRNTHVENVAHTGIKFTGKNRSIQNILVENCKVIETGGPGIQMSGVIQGHVTGNFVNKSGSDNDSRKWGRGSGLWTWGSSDILIEKNHFLNANGPADSAGAHIDFNCENIILQYNFSANNAGGFCEVLGNNYNCAYRYNISVNDGHRVKGENGDFQEGKTLWLSGFAGKNKKRNGPFNTYIYNNTIYVSKDIISKFAFDRASSGALIMNNIFYIEGESDRVLGDQYKPEIEGASTMKNIIFKNNLFLRPDNWPEKMSVKDESAIFGDPGFIKKGGMEIKDYRTNNKSLIKDKGQEVKIIPEDLIGLVLGLQIQKDILGNPIVGNPDMGAIEFGSGNN